MKSKLFLISILALSARSSVAERILHVPMDGATGESLPVAVGGERLSLFSKTAPENIPGAAGDALRLDGFSTYAYGTVTPGKADGNALSVSMWVAPETYPVIALDTPTDGKITLAGTLDESSRSGWRFALGYTGKYSFECFSGGWKVSVEASGILPCYEWSRLTAVVDGASGTATLYRNGSPVGQSRCMATVDNSAPTLYIGRDREAAFSGPFMINTFNGVIDDLEVFDNILSGQEIARFSPENEADLSIPASRYASQLMRPRFHGMPATAWTNECHGMTFSDGRFHLFFQKNANGPYMTRLHWGHISSPDLIDWREERIAIAPGDPYDVKGCWSGAIISDDVLTGGRPAAVYTAVDYAKATICLASPDGDDLVSWTKSASNPLINGRPSGLSDDFRDPYFFRDGDNAYIIVGTSKDGRGAATLHKMDPATKRFSNDGSIFFTASDAASQGTFWEMPNITPMPDGKWLFTVTPLGLSGGVRCLYWTGAIAADGTFRPDGAPASVELNSKEGYGLLSPTIYNHNGKIIALGIVPDKLPAENNYSLGWAHCYSLPREWSLGADGSLVQKPYEGLRAMRSDKSVSLTGTDLSGVRELSPVSGRQVEIAAEFVVSDSRCGFRVFDDGASAAKIYYDPLAGEVVADFSALDRWANDSRVYDGVYRMKLPRRIASGERLRLNVFVDGSVIDIFVNDTWAQSIRVFPLSETADGVSVYSDGAVHLNSLDAWVLKSGAGAGVHDVALDASAGGKVNVYHISGRLVKHAVSHEDAVVGLDSGVSIINGRKVMVK